MTLGVENIEGSTSMSTTMPGNTRATPDSRPGYSQGIGPSGGQEAQKRFLRERRALFESGKASGFTRHEVGGDIHTEDK